MLKLSIVHNIFLKQEEVNILNSKQNISVIGVCLPVWSFNKNSSEPAEEVFCEYEIQNNETKPIEILKNKYKIYLPDYLHKMHVKLNKKQFDALSDLDKTFCVVENGETFLSKQPILLEADDEAIAFKQYEKIKHGDKIKLVEHNVQIKKMKSLYDSF